MTRPINHVEMCHICGNCDKDCETAHKDGSCALADLIEDDPDEKN